MGIFSLIIIIPLLILYSIFCDVLLKAMNVKVSTLTLFTIVILGGVAGLVSMALYGFIVADDNGQLNNVLEVIGMFVISGTITIFISIASAKIIDKYKK